MGAHSSKASKAARVVPITSKVDAPLRTRRTDSAQQNGSGPEAQVASSASNGRRSAVTGSAAFTSSTKEVFRVENPFGEVYMGELVDGQMHGQGVYEFNNGGMYVGMFVNGVM